MTNPTPTADAKVELDCENDSANCVRAAQWRGYCLIHDNTIASLEPSPALPTEAMWFDKAIREHMEEHGPSGGAWNISMVLERLHRAAPTGLPTEAMIECVDAAKYAVAKARLQLARLLDHAVMAGLSDESDLAKDTFQAIIRLNTAFPSATDQGTGLPLEAAAPTAPAVQDEKRPTPLYPYHDPYRAAAPAVQDADAEWLRDLGERFDVAADDSDRLYAIANRLSTPIGDGEVRVDRKLLADAQTAIQRSNIYIALMQEYIEATEQFLFTQDGVICGLSGGSDDPGRGAKKAWKRFTDAREAMAAHETSALAITKSTDADGAQHD